jgi:Big-like domain-containing protein
MPNLRFLLCLAILLSFKAAGHAQTPAQSGAGAPADQGQTVLPPAAAPEADADSADIPPFARDRISQEEYFALRDQEINRRRGIDDLIRSPRARSLAISKVEVQEKFLRFTVQGLNPLSALLPAALVASWTPLGPAPIPNGQTTGPEVPVSGRVTAIAVDPATAQTVYVGTAQGGLYRSLDGGNTWTPLMDSAQSLAIGALALDPQNSDTLFVGTGEGNLSGDSFFGVGLYIIRGASTAAPVLTGPFNSDGTKDVFTGRAITKIIVHPTDNTKILVSTASGASGLSADSFGTLPNRGVYLSTNAQSPTPTFTRLTVPTGSPNRTITDMVMDPGDPTRILVWVFGTATAPGDGGLWMSTAGDPWANTATWTQNPNFIRQGFGKFAVNRSGVTPTTTFALAQDEDATCAGVTRQGSLKTSVDGVTWNTIAAASGFCGGQCFYDMVPSFHPANTSIIFLGGSSNSSGACASNVFARSTNGGGVFSRIDNGLHADSHVLVFAPSNSSVIYVGNDGGIFRSDDGGTTWASKNTAGFNATQFVSFSVHPTDANFAIGGTQDNGTEFMRPDGAWIRADFGDGGYSAIDQGSVDTAGVSMYHIYFNVTNSQILLASVTNVANASEGLWSLFGCPGGPGISANGINCADAVLFYAPIALGPGTPNTIYFGTDHLYRSPDRGATMTLVSQALDCCDAGNSNLSFRVSAIGISPQDDNVRLVGLTNGKVFATTTGANTMTNVTGPWSPKFVARTVVDPNNKATAYVTLDGYGTQAATVLHVWKTTNLTGEPPIATWSSAANGLPDVPVNAFAVDPLNSNYLYAGTDIGVFASIDGGFNWAAYGSGLPRVAVFDLNLQKTSRKVRIGTHGRGAWEIPAALFANITLLGTNLPSPTLGQNVILTTTIDREGGVNVPTGTVTFFDGAGVLGAASVDGSGKATFQTTALTQGAHNITATYGGDALYLSSSSAAVNLNVTPVGSTATTTALASNTNSSVFGNVVTLTANVAHATGAAVPTGSVTFDDGASFIGAAGVDAQGTASILTQSLGVGSHSITAVYSGDATYAASTSAAVAVVVRGSTALGLAAGSTSPVAGASVTFTATLTTFGSQAVPTGQVTFKDGATTLGQSAFAGSAVTSFQTSTLSLGPHSITAQYPGDSTYVGSASAAVAITVVAAPDYQVSIPNGSATISAGQSASFNISVAPQGGFSGTVSFNCSGLPAASSCSFIPATVAPNGSAVNTMLIIATTARGVASARPLGGKTLAAFFCAGFLAIVFFGFPSRRLRHLRSAGMLVLVLALVPGLASCGGGGSRPPVVTGTPAGTFSVTVSATSGATTHSSVITLVVQ